MSMGKERVKLGKNLTTEIGSGVIPAIVLATGEKGAYRFLEFFAADIRNYNTRMAYYRAACTFFEWCRQKRVANLADIGTHHVAAYIEHLGRVRSKPTVKQHLAAIRMLFNWLVVGQIDRAAQSRDRRTRSQVCGEKRQDPGPAR